jgi:uncharacterized protein (UPF0264 family)
MAGLLVSVRSAAEALIALDGGASIIDVKEPSRGSLGRADEATIAEVVRAVAGRRPVSAALGELLDDPPPPTVSGLAYAKWGLAGCGAKADWSAQLAAASTRLRERHPICQPVAVAYADASRADAPPPAAVVDVARRLMLGIILFDTHAKDGRGLLDWMPLATILRLLEVARAGGLKVALAGSLGAKDVATLREASPDWFAVRGAACHRGHREGCLDGGAVQRLVRLVERGSRS